MRELLAMLRGHRREAWQHTSFLAAYMIAPWSKKPVKPADINPTTDGNGNSMALNRDTVSMLKVFLPRKRRRR